jgi:hypothetical protein
MQELTVSLGSGWYELPGWDFDEGKITTLADTPDQAFAVRC